MASAVVASPNEAHWGDCKVHMRKYATINSKTSAPFAHSTTNTYPNTRPSKLQDHSSNLHFQHRCPPPLLPLQSASTLRLKSVADNKPRESLHGDYVTFNLGVCAERELKELKKRLVSELEQVRALKTRLETLNPHNRAPISPHSQLPATRPPSLQVDNLVAATGATKPANRTPKSRRKAPGKGTKRSNPFFADPDPKRQAMDPLTEKILTSMMKRCGQILSKIMKQKAAWAFNKPVDVEGMGLYDYNQIIKKPMDLGTVKSNLDNKVYKSPTDFAADVRLTFDNALTYNPKEHNVHVMALQLLTKFNDMFNPAYKKFEDEHIRVFGQKWRAMEEVEVVSKAEELPVLVERSVEDVVLAVAESRRVPEKLPKPKNKDLKEREMSFEERSKLGKELEELPGEWMGQLLQIVKKRCGRLVQDGNEIELDMEFMDSETLWELQRFVNNCKKMTSKIKRQGPNANLNQQMAPAPLRESSPVKHHKVVAEEDVDIGEEIPAGNYPPVEIERDVNLTTDCASGRSGSSSSSSSGSGSSSCSGSDSGGSSGCDSDADGAGSPYVEADGVRIN